MGIISNLLSDEGVCLGIITHILYADAVDDTPSTGCIDLVAQANAKGTIGDSQIERLVPVVTFAHINSRCRSCRWNECAIGKLNLSYATIHLCILAVGSDVNKTTSLTLAGTLSIIVGIAHHVFLEVLIALAIEGSSAAEALQAQLIDAILEVGDVLICIKGLACLLSHTIADSKLDSRPEVAVVGEVGILDDREEASIVGVFLSADSTEAILELVVGNDNLVIVGVGHA